MEIGRLGQRLRQWNGKPNPLSITDATLGTLAKLKSLETLGLDEVRLTHAGLVQLKALPNLKKLTLQRADIPEADIAKRDGVVESVDAERIVASRARKNGAGERRTVDQTIEVD